MPTGSSPSPAGVARDAAAVLDLDPARIAVVANPVDAERIAELAGVRPAHAWLESGAPPVLLSVGKLQPQKDHATLLRAFALLRAQRPVRLVILGDGPLPGRLERLARELGIADEVAFSGFVVDPFGWMAQAAAVVSSSRFEGLSNVLIEALAAGATIVATDCPHGPAEVLDHGACGRLVPVGDAAALAAAMAAALDDPADPVRQRARARSFALDTAVEGYLRVLRPLARPLAEAA